MKPIKRCFLISLWSIFGQYGIRGSPDAVQQFRVFVVGDRFEPCDKTQARHIVLHIVLETGIGVGSDTGDLRPDLPHAGIAKKHLVVVGALGVCYTIPQYAYIRTVGGDIDICADEGTLIVVAVLVCVAHSKKPLPGDPAGAF